MRADRKIFHEGRVWYGVPKARTLGATTPKIREALGRGDLERTRLRINGKLLVTIESLLA
ncbi:MAG: hypothetical protein FGM15_13610 [Chthoniobacterales bacterium]|nr:hypothetical protein [Chthoniobacterales bacterium]